MKLKLLNKVRRNLRQDPVSDFDNDRSYSGLGWNPTQASERPHHPPTLVSSQASPENITLTNLGSTQINQPLKSTPVQVSAADRRSDDRLLTANSGTNVPKLQSVEPAMADRNRESYWAKAAAYIENHDSEASKKLLAIQHYDDNIADRLTQLANTPARKRKGICPPVEGAMKCILEFKDIGAAAAAFDSTKVTPIVWKGFCLVLQFCINDLTLLREISKNLAEVTAMIRYWTNVECLYLTGIITTAFDKFEPLKEQLIKLYAEILKLEVFLVDLCNKGSFVQIFSTPATANTLKNHVEKINTFHSVCKTNFEICKTKIEQHVKVKDWIVNQQPEEFHDNILFDTQSDKYQSSGQWLFGTQEFKSWSSGDSIMLWIKGPPGTGKTTLLSRIIQRHLDMSSVYADQRLAYYYCARNEAARNSYKTVLRALLRQAVYDPINGTISQKVLDVWKAGENPFSFSKCETLIAGVMRDGIKLRFVIDALDECDEPKELLKVLRNLSQAAPGRLSLLVSSRNSVQVQEKFNGLLEVDLAKSMNKADMYTYVVTEIKEREKDERLLRGEYPDLEDKLIELLLRKANGMFRWVELQISFFLKPKSSILLRKTVEGYLKKLSQKTLAGEKALNEIYGNIFDRNSAEGSLERKHATKIYQIMISCAFPVTMEFLVKAMDFNEPNEDEVCRLRPNYILELTRDFIVETTNDKIRFAHPSAVEYLQQQQADYDSGQCHAQMAKICLEYLLRVPSKTLLLLTRNDSNDYLGSYAKYSWAYHCSILGNRERQKRCVSGLLIEWLDSENFQHWCRQRRGYKFDGLSTPIGAASIWNFVEVAEAKLPSQKQRYDKSRTQHDESPLHLAAQYGNVDMIELLLKNGIDIELKQEIELGIWSMLSDLHSITPLATAMAYGQTTAVNKLLECGAKPYNRVRDEQVYSVRNSFK
ncbi:hypothetical protein F4860DRAFT_381533 [Xylaria cubensis]|nr:hypothetical protein F4860DRAFT_381533 [Xylaria cubensis]